MTRGEYRLVTKWLLCPVCGCDDAYRLHYPWCLADDSLPAASPDSGTATPGGDA